MCHSQSVHYNSAAENRLVFRCLWKTIKEVYFLRVCERVFQSVKTVPDQSVHCADATECEHYVIGQSVHSVV